MLAVRSIGKLAFRAIVSNIYNLIGLKSVIRGSSKDHYFNTTYTKSFKLPPVFTLVSSPGDIPPSLNFLSGKVHKTTMLFFISKLKYVIFVHSLRLRV